MAKPNPRAEPGTTPKEPTRERTTFNLPIALVEAMRDCVDYLSGPPPQGVRLTLSAFITSAVEREIARLQNKHCDGKPFPTMKGELKRGRPRSR